MRFINGRILFIIFLIMSGSLLLMQQTFGMLTANRFTDTYNKNMITEPICGEVYKTAWNRESDFVVNCKDYKVLVRGSGLSDAVFAKIKTAEFITLKTNPKVPEVSSNFGEFDMRKYLAAKNIDYIAYPTDNCIEIGGSDRSIGMSHSIHYYSYKCREYIKNTLIKKSDIDTASVCMSVMTGDSALLENETKSTFQKAGLSHLMAVSGAHVAYVVNPIKKFLKVFRTRRLGIKSKNLILAPFVFMLAFISGFSPSIMRASLMYICLIISVIFCRKYDSLNALGFAGIVLLLINPCYVFDVGFILSFGACICMYTVLPALKNIKVISDLPCKKVTDGLLSGVSVSLGITPIVINMFNGFSPASIMVNLIASPLAQLICTGSYILVFSTLIGLPAILTTAFSYMLTSVVLLLQKCASGSKNGFFGYHRIASGSVVFVIVYYTMLLLFVFYIGRKAGQYRLMGLSTLGVISVCLIMLYIPPKAEFVFFDVGQGVSVLFKTRDGYCGLIDTGDGSTDISELLLKEGVAKLDFIIVSHGHNDHSGGFEDIVDDYKCDVIFFPDNDHDLVVGEYASNDVLKNTTVKYIDGETELKIGEYTSMKLFCNPNNKNINDSSVVAVFEGDWGSVVLPGDIEQKSEISFSEKYKNDVDLICVPHHGSNTSSGEDFLKTLNPEYAIISVGKNNMYGHPSLDVIDRIDDYTYSDGVYRTDTCGAVKFQFGMLLDFCGEDVKIWQKKKLSE